MQQKCSKIRPDEAELDSAKNGFMHDSFVAHELLDWIACDLFGPLEAELIRAKRQERMAACEAAWREGEVLAIAEAMTWARAYNPHVPAWLEEAVVQLAIAVRRDQQAKNYAQAAIRLKRYMAVRDLKFGRPVVADGKLRYVPQVPKKTWPKAFVQASELLAKTSAAGSPDMMKDAYYSVRNHLDRGQSGKYFNLKDPRYRHNGRPG